MRVSALTPDRLVLYHNPLILIGVMGLFELIALGRLARTGWHLPAEDLFFVVYGLLVPVALFKWVHHVRVTFDRNMDCISISRCAVLGFRRREHYALRDLYRPYVLS